MSIKQLSTLSSNPFFAERVIAHFVSGSSGSASLWRVFLVLPFVQYGPSRHVLSTAKLTSTVDSLFLDNPNKREPLIGLEQRYNYYRLLTSQALIIGAHDKVFEVGTLVVSSERCKYQEEKDSYLRTIFRAAFYLGAVFSQESDVDLFLKLGVVPK